MANDVLVDFIFVTLFYFSPIHFPQLGQPVLSLSSAEAYLDSWVALQVRLKWILLPAGHTWSMLLTGPKISLRFSRLLYMGGKTIVFLGPSWVQLQR